MSTLVTNCFKVIGWLNWIHFIHNWSEKLTSLKILKYQESIHTVTIMSLHRTPLKVECIIAIKLRNLVVSKFIPNLWLALNFMNIPHYFRYWYTVFFLDSWFQYILYYFFYAGIGKNTMYYFSNTGWIKMN